MKKIITAVLLLVFCLQTAGCSALAVMTSKSQADNGQFVSASPSKLAKELIAASANSDWDNYPSNSTSTKNAGSRTYEQKPQQTRIVDMTGIGNNPTSIKITGTMTKEQKQEAFKEIMKAKGYSDFIINSLLEHIQWNIIDDNTIQDTLAVVDLLNKYDYSGAMISYVLGKQKKVTRKEFNQICENIEIVLGNKYNLSSTAKDYFLWDFVWNTFAKPLAPSYLKLVEKDEYFAVHINNIPIHNEKNASAALENYNFMKNTGVLDNKAIYNVIYTTDWSTYNGKNYALRLQTKA